MKKYFFIFLLFCSLVYGGNFIDFNESFGLTNFNYTDCYVNGNFDYTRFQLGTLITEFDYNWRCQRNHVDIEQYILNDSSRANTDSDVKFVTGVHSNDDRVAISSVFGENRIINKDTEISFYCGDFDNGDGDNEIYLIFGNKTDEVLSFALRETGGTECNDYPPSNCCDDLVQLTSTECDGSIAQLVNFTLEDAYLLCGNLNYSLLNSTDNYIISYVSIEIVGDDYTYFIDDLDITNLLNGSNDLPECNVTVDAYSKCMDDTGTALFDIDIDCYDLEGDVILYADEQLDFLSRYYLVSEKFSLNQEIYYGDSNNYDLEFFTSGNFYSNYSYPESRLENDLVISGIYGHENDYNYMRYVNGNIVLATSWNVPEWYYFIDENLEENIDIGFVVGFLYTNTKVEIETIGNGGQIFNLTLNYTANDRLMVYQNSSEIANISYSKFTEGYRGYLIINEILNNYNNTLRLIIKDESTVVYDDVFDIDIEDFKGLRFLTDRENDGLNAYWIMDSLTIRGYNYFPYPDFDTTYGNVRLDLGTTHYKVFVTDSEHELTEYNEYDLWLSVLGYDECVLTNQTDMRNILGLSQELAGGTFQEYLIVMGLKEEFEILVWVIYVCALTALSIMFYKVRQTPAIFDANLISCCIAFIPSFFGMLVYHMVTFLLLGSLSLAVILSRDLDGK